MDEKGGRLNAKIWHKSVQSRRERTTKQTERNAKGETHVPQVSHTDLIGMIKQAKKRSHLSSKRKVCGDTLSKIFERVFGEKIREPRVIKVLGPVPFV